MNEDFDQLLRDETLKLNSNATDFSQLLPIFTSRH
jgi:hypothetical protein